MTPPVATAEHTAGKRTPGPWMAQAIDEGGAERGCVSIVGDNLGGLVAMACPWPTELDDDDFSRVEANAHLIAAAPTMLEALKITARGLEGEFGPRVAEVNFPQLYAAIALAEGRQS